jgi:arginyl-tRNA synthetase
MEIDLLLKSGICNALYHLYDATVDIDSIKLEPTNADFRGDFTFVTFPFLKTSKKNPEQTANEIGAYLQSNLREIESFNVVKGFLNIGFTQSFWIEKFKAIDNLKIAESKGKVMVEYSSPNTNKPLHLGHVRNNLLGFSVSTILKTYGFDVTQANLINDRGIHICKSMIAWQKFGNGETPESSGLKGDHLVGKYYVEFDKQFKTEIKTLIESGVEAALAEKQAPLILEAQEMLRKWEAGDSEVIELWKKMNAWVYAGFEITYKNLGVHFDQYYYESNTYLLGKDLIEEGLNKNVFYKKEDGSVWIDLRDEGLDEKLVLRSDGTSVYITQDIGTAELKYNQFACDKSIYVVGNEQDYHFKVLFLILKKLGKTWANGLYHLSYGMVDLPSGKMKSREGTVVDADDLMQEMIDTAKAKTEELGKTDNMPEQEKIELHRTLGLGALKFFMLKVDPQKRMLFNPEESIDLQGDTGPFVQYTYARISSMLRAANLEDLNAGFEINSANETEINLVKELDNYKQELQKAALTYSPSLIANYALNLAKSFNRVYNDVSFLKEEDNNKRRFRMSLALKTSETIKQSLGMLGINVPNRM